MSIAVLVIIAALFVIVFATACFTIFHLKATPVRIAAVILALVALVGALVPVVRLLTEQPQAQPAPPAGALHAPGANGLSGEGI
ncbi:hypothetical protein ACIQ7Q_34230 [Streptomyces sp. NPDC096176]|uniref:hypothetical protein n=1 Tax=Streptomyces sp. NPDC096176 TaxID=3366079 RepID=UPI0037FB64C0